MISVTSYTLTLIKGAKLEAVFSGLWERCITRESNDRVFLDINHKCFGAVVDYLNEIKFAPQ